MLDAFAAALAEVFALADAEGLDAALACAVAVRLAGGDGSGLTVAAAVGGVHGTGSQGAFSDRYRCGWGWRLLSRS